MNRYMLEAYREAELAYSEDEVPVGAVIVRNGDIISRGHNTRARELNIAGHAEINAIKTASANLGRNNLEDCEIYITLEPCPMCISAILQSYIKKIYFGAYDKNMGAVESFMKINEFPLGDNTKVVGGIMEKKCSDILVRFFKELRK